VTHTWWPQREPLPYGHAGPSVPSSRKHGGVSYGETDSTISMFIFHYATLSFFPPAGVACAGNHVLRWGTGTLGIKGHHHGADEVANETDAQHNGNTPFRAAAKSESDNMRFK
jgi:hypothetical protein